MLFIAFGVIAITKPYKFTRFGAIAITKPYRFIGFGAIAITKPYKFIGFGDSYYEMGVVHHPAAELGSHEAKGWSKVPGTCAPRSDGRLKRPCIRVFLLPGTWAWLHFGLVNKL